jgi:hypothetical protein
MGQIVGMIPGETLVGIDFRPANGVLYGVSTMGGVYMLTENMATGAVNAVRTSTLTDAATNQVLLLSGSTFGVDFNPVPDRLRVVSDTGQNLRINVDNGMTNVDTVLTPAIGATAAGYTNNDLVASTATVLYTLNTMTDQLNIQSPPNNGNQTVVGAVGIDGGNVSGFDIFTVQQQNGAALRNRAIALLSSSPTTTGMNLYQINLETGAATLLPIPGGSSFSVWLLGMAIPLVQSGTVVF